MTTPMFFGFRRLGVGWKFYARLIAALVVILASVYLYLSIQRPDVAEVVLEVLIDVGPASLAVVLVLILLLRIVRHFAD